MAKVQRNFCGISAKVQRQIILKTMANLRRKEHVISDDVIGRYSMSMIMSF